MGQIVLTYPGGQHIKLTGSTVALTFDGVIPVTYPQVIRRDTTLQAPAGPTVLSFADMDGNPWQTAVTVPAARALIVDPSAAEVAAGEDANAYTPLPVGNLFLAANYH